MQNEADIATRGLAVMEAEGETGIGKRFLKIEELSEYMGTPVATLYTWTHQRKIPHLKMGRSVRFDLREIEEWIKRRRVAVSTLAETLTGGR